jgi:hypothetical protein
VTITVSPDAFAGAGGVCETDHVGPIPIGTARRLGCDASVIVRDGGCRLPGCDRRHSWCDAHHIVHWAEGGATALSNLILLCRQHHRTIHAGRARLEMDDGLPVFRRSDGSRLDPSIS